MAAMRMKRTPVEGRVPVRAHPNTRVRVVLLQTLDREARRLVEAWPKARRGRAEALRQVRIATRRLRQLAAVVGRAGLERRAETVARDLRAIGKALGPLRDLAMAVEFLAPYEERHDIGRAAGEARAAFARERDVADAAARVAMKGVSINRVTRRLASLRAAVAAAPDAATWARALTVAVSRRALDASEALSRASALYDPERLHAIRIAIKKLRYATEMAADARLVPPGTPARFARAQKRLGAWHDRVAVLQLIRQAQADGLPASETSWRRLADTLDREAHVLHGQVRRGRASLERSLVALRARVAGRALLIHPSPLRAALRPAVTRRARPLGALRVRQS
jgi:CHAD domain-containing protein